ncbi:MAG: hypothetical protein NZ959_01285 [Armatimonadetes bacterium]|nr:hypothetical protein [Armatimonadota bacterium]MDW8122119.1 hypothetical protein [Armatimonadota bacterium]
MDRRRFLKIVGALFAVGACGGVGWFWWKRGEPFRVAWGFVGALDKNDYRRALETVVTAEREMVGITPEVATAAFEALNLPPLRLVGIRDG